MTCISRNIYAETEEFYLLSLHILSLFQIPIHIFGTLIVIYKTPRAMEGIKYTMLLLHLAGGYLDIMLSLLSLAYVIYPSHSGSLNGILFKIGVPIPLIGYLSLNSILILVGSIIIFFEERYNRLVRTDRNTQSRQLKRIVHHCVNFIFVFIVYIPAFLNMPDQEEGRKKDLLDYPCLPRSFVESPGYCKMPESMILSIGPLIFTMIFGTGQAVYFAFRTGLKLFETKAQSKRTSTMQKKFFFSLCIQVAVPILLIILPCLYIQITAIVGYVDLLFGNISMIWLSFHGTFSTIVMLSVHKPYRLATLHFFHLRKTAPTTPMLVAKTSVSRN